jgi:hypothetical protein
MGKTKKKPTKKRAKHYESKLKLEQGVQFIDIINAAVAPEKKK